MELNISLAQTERQRLNSPQKQAGSVLSFVGTGAPITVGGMDRVCEMLGVGEAEIWAVLTVETRGMGFYADRRPQILFERHIFSRETGARHDTLNPDISSGKCGGYVGGPGEYQRLETAMTLAQESALRSASWGLAQIMGFNHQIVGFDSVADMVETMVESEDRQLLALANYVLAYPRSAIALQRHDWTSFAAAYNGRDFRRNDYHNRLGAAFEKCRRLIPDIALRTAQVALYYLGHDPGPVDGLPGRRTRGALADFQMRLCLPETGELDDMTEMVLTAEAFPSAA